MRIHNVERFFVLTAPKSDESIIDNIYREDIVVIDEESQTPVVRSEERIDYRFYFLADLRNALNDDLKLVRLSVRATLTQAHYSFFNSLNTRTSQGVVAALYARNIDISDEMFEADREGLLHRSNIDLFKNFDNLKLSNAKNLSDRQLFGTIEVTRIISAEEMRKRGGDQQLAQKTITTIDSEFLNASSFSENYENALAMGSDPSSFLFPTDDETPADPRLRGCFSRKSMLTGDYYSDGCLTSMRYQMLGSPTAYNTATDSVSVSQLQPGSSAAITRKEPNRIRLNAANITLKKSDLVGRQYFFLILDIIDSKGIISQTLIMKINHRKNIDDYYAPTSEIESKITFPFGSNKKSARISLKKSDPNIAACDIYLREISETFPIVASPFKVVKRVTFRQGGKTYDDTLMYPVNEIFTIPTVEDKMTIMRVVPISKTGKVFGNFSSSVKKNGPFVPYRAAILTSCTRDGIKVNLKKVSPNAVGVCFEKRDITQNERNFSPVINSLEVEPNSTSIESPGSGAGSLESKGGSFKVHDKNCKDGHLYEYRAKLYLKEGVTRTSIVSRFETFIPPLGLISTVITDMKVSPITSPPLRTEISEFHAPITVSFNIDFKIAPTDADKVLEGLESAGLSNFYSTELASVKTSLQNIIFFNVERFNTQTGETFYLGMFPFGNNIIDDGITTAALCPILGQIYLYRITPCLVQPNLAVQSITEASGDINTTADLRNPSTYAKLQAAYEALAGAIQNQAILQQAYNSIKSSKNFSRSSFERGTLPGFTNEGSLAEFSTGDYVEKTISTGYESIKISNVSVGVGKRAGPIIRWRSVGTTTSRSLIDFFTVLVIKQGEKYIAGTCHRVVSDDFRFVDFNNKDYVGFIEYFVRPVFLSGRMGEEISLGSTTLLDRNTSFRRGN